MQFERLTQEQAEQSLDKAIEMFEKEPSYIKFQNLQKMLWILDHRGYNVRQYQDLYRELWKQYAEIYGEKTH